MRETLENSALDFFIFTKKESHVAQADLSYVDEDDLDFSDFAYTFQALGLQACAATTGFMWCWRPNPVSSALPWVFMYRY